MYQTLQEECYEANQQLPKLGLVLFTFGNVSAVDRNRAVFAIKPSGVPYEKLQPGDIVICDYDARVVAGTLRPSSDTKTHALLYKTWGDIGGITHTLRRSLGAGGHDHSRFRNNPRRPHAPGHSLRPGPDRRDDSGRL